MSRLFVHSPRFRLISPIFSGSLIYLLLLLLNNNVQALRDHFLGQELYFCIILSYIIQEFSRLFILFFSKKNLLQSNWLSILSASLASMLLTVILVTGAISGYYYFLIGFEPNKSELITFNSIFITINLIYITLYLSYDLLARIHEIKLKQEKTHKQELQADFQQFRRGLNPQLLLESLENLIVLSKTDQEQAEGFVDNLAMVYRYVLSKRHELIDVHSELRTLGHLVELFNYLPGRVLILNSSIKDSFLVVPGVLLRLVEGQLRNAISSPKVAVYVQLSETSEFMEMKVQLVKKLGADNTAAVLEEMNQTYAIYSDQPIDRYQENGEDVFKIPKLYLEQ